MASLPPLSSEIFTEKVLANQATAAATAAKATFEKLCSACQKTYFSENAFRNHLNSQKHRQRVARMQNGSELGVAEDETNSVMSSAFSLGEPIDTKSTATQDEAAEQEFSAMIDGIKNANVAESEPLPRRPSRPHHSAHQDKEAHPLSPSSDDDDDDGEAQEGTTDAQDPAILEKCLFCNFLSDTLLSNISHMKLKHGLFIPEQDFLVDVEGLVRWLHDRVSFLHECLYCGILRHTTSGIQTHMRDKGHCMIAFDSEEQMVEVGQFYDFTSTYSDQESEEEDADEGVKLNEKSRLGARREAETLEIEDDLGTADADGGGWETDEEESAMDGQEPKKMKGLSSTASQPVFHDEDGLHLPSGRTVGHRSLAKYFRQNLHNYPTPAERASRLAITESATEEDDETASQRTLTPRGGRASHQNQSAITRANGGLGMVGVSDAKKSEVRILEKQDQRRAQRQQNRYQWGIKKRANQQKHFRDPLLQ